MPPEPEMDFSPEIIHVSPPHRPVEASCDPHAHGCRWWPYSNSNDFGANAAMILIILICALICALALNTAIRCFLRGGHRLSQLRREIDEEQPKPKADNNALLVVAPTIMYSAGMKLGGAEADCAICLSEFVEGQGIRVLGSCKHGFHAQCIERWLSSHSSCPTCRRSCLALENTAGDDKTSGQPVTDVALVESV